MNRKAINMLIIPALICSLPFFLLHLVFPSIYHRYLSYAVKSVRTLTSLGCKEEKKFGRTGSEKEAEVSLFDTYFKSIIRLIGLKSKADYTLNVC